MAIKNTLTSTCLALAISAASFIVKADRPVMMGCTSEESPISVVNDATFCLRHDNENAFCSGFGEAPLGTACPSIGAVASRDCHNYLASYHEELKVCIAKESASCEKLSSGSWGCVFPSEATLEEEMKQEAEDTEEDTAAFIPTGSVIHVCNDASYYLSQSMLMEGEEANTPCGGTGDAPTGTACPRRGDASFSDCYRHLRSYVDFNKHCFAPEDAVCMQYEGTTSWGCQFPTVGCDRTVIGGGRPAGQIGGKRPPSRVGGKGSPPRAPDGSRRPGPRFEGGYTDSSTDDHHDHGSEDTEALNPEFIAGDTNAAAASPANSSSTVLLLLLLVPTFLLLE